MSALERSRLLANSKLAEPSLRKSWHRDRYLFERAGSVGLTEEDLEEEAGKLIAPYETVLWQAWRGGVSLWDIELRTPRRNFFF